MRYCKRVDVCLSARLCVSFKFRQLNVADSMSLIAVAKHVAISFRQKQVAYRMKLKI